MRTPSSRRGFTLIELMVVAAIIVILMGVTIPAISSLIKSNALSQADNTLRAALFSARTYAVQNCVVAGVRCQEDGTIIQIFARREVTDGSGAKLLDMKAVDSRLPDQLPPPYAVTMWDVGAYGYGYKCDTGDMVTRWIGPTESGYQGSPEWLDEENTWFAYPVVLFSPQGRVIFRECQFSGDSNSPWYPKMNQYARKVTYCDSDGNLIPNRYVAQTGSGPAPDGHDRIKYTNQTKIVGWRCNDYKGSMSHDVPVDAPSLTSCPRLFDFEAYRGITNKKQAVGAIFSTSRDLSLEIETGMLVRRY